MDNLPDLTNILKSFKPFNVPKFDVPDVHFSALDSFDIPEQNMPDVVRLEPLEERLYIDELLSTLREQATVLHEQNDAFREYVCDAGKSAVVSRWISLASLAVAFVSLVVTVISFWRH